MFVRKSWAICRLITVVAWTLRAVMAAPQLTTIEDTLYKADGTKFNGLAIISWKSFEAADTANVAAHVKTVQVVDGYLRVQLAPSTNAVPSFSYTVRYNSNGKVQWDELWAVPASSGVLKVRDVRVTDGQNSTLPPAQLQESEVVGLAEDLDARPTKGAAYTPNAVAVVNGQGELDSVQGTPTDCVHVDGSSGPCTSAATGPSYVENETPMGNVDGTNATFALAGAPDPAASLMLFRNGLLQKPSQDYLITGASITFLPVSQPRNGDILTASYRLNPTNGTVQFADSETPAGAANGTNAAFALAHVPNPTGSPAVYRNGLFMKSGLDYTISGQTLQFLPVSIPQPGDTILVYYRY